MALTQDWLELYMAVKTANSQLKRSKIEQVMSALAYYEDSKLKIALLNFFQLEWEFAFSELDSRNTMFIKLLNNIENFTGRDI
jgi:hypothetical protein